MNKKIITYKGRNVEIDESTRQISSYVPMNEATLEKCKEAFDTLQKELCPYRIIVKGSAFDISKTLNIFNWIRDNLSGKWYHVLQNCYGFELAEDAIAFKLFWTEK